MTSFFALFMKSIMMRENERERRTDASYFLNQLLNVHSNNGVSMAHDEDERLAGFSLYDLPKSVIAFA